jgi:hypothetical protein
LQKSFQRLLTDDNGEVEISIYFGEITPQEGVKQAARVKAAFPSLHPEFFTIFLDRMIEKGFSDKRMIDAVNNVIDTCIYPTPTIANFTTFDKRAKLYTYDEVVTKVSRKECTFEDFALITVNGEVYRVRKSDKARYNLPDEI